MSLIGGTVIVTSLGIVLPDLYTGIASMGIGATSLFNALQVYRDSARKKINMVILEELR